ncbi:MAG: diguanylate cyclase, partial [Vallitaleaceae bacterium]|nr:diguanylate cyclase [Vallitaleaceae bacterium]
NRLFIVPFYQLNRSIMEKGNQLGGRIFGLNRKDEFGDLANTIQEMKVQLDDSRIRLQKESDYKSGEILRIFDTIPVGVFVLDENFHIVYLNKYLIELFQVRDNQVCRIDGTQDCSFAFANKKDYDEFIKRINTDRLVQVEYRLFSGTQEFWAEIKVTQLTNDKGTLRFEGLLTNIQERKHFEENLITRSITDSLTGIYNRSRFDEVIHEEIERNNRYGENVSLMIFDLDFFKRVNDTFGHDVGDQVLIEVAETVKKEIRVTDIFARWGGEEFAILMPHTDSESGMHVAEKVRLSIAAIVHEEVGRVTASFGVSEYITGESYVDWFKRVDIALFEAKGKGRNRVELNSIRRAEDSLGVVRLKWSIAYESGHNEIDEEHKQLLNLANDLFHSSLVLNQREKETEALERIIKHVNQHFRHEIQILKEHQYENYEEHSKIHTALFEHLSMLKKMYDNDEIKATAFFSVIVDEIIIGHLIKEDTKFFSLFNISAENSPTS